MIGIDLFAGAGGMSLGAHMAGIDVQLVIEADKNAAQTYLANHSPKYGLFADDIRRFKKIPIENKNEPVIVFGGPPCQGFSTSNQKTRSLQNEKNWLFREFARVTSLYRPEWVVFENVRGILETEGGLFVEKILRELERLGYTTSHAVLQACDFGIPQKRSRFFIVGSIDGVKLQFPKPLSHNNVSVKQAFSGLPTLKNGDTICFRHYRYQARSSYAKLMTTGKKGCHNHLVTKNSDLIVERYKHIPQGGNWESIPSRMMRNYANPSRCHTGIYRRLVENQPSVVIGNYRKNMLIHPTEHRGLSVREAARLQSFPDDFRFLGSIGFQQQQVGNAVPPLLAKTLFQSILEQR